MTRRGNQAVEFAVTLPLLMMLLSGSVDAGEYLVLTEALVQASADGARAGARSEDDAVGSAEAAAELAWTATGHHGSPTFTAELTGTAPDQRVTLEAELAFAPWFGMVPMPDTIAYRCAFLLDHQPED